MHDEEKVSVVFHHIGTHFSYDLIISSLNILNIYTILYDWKTNKILIKMKMSDIGESLQLQYHLWHTQKVNL